MLLLLQGHESIRGKPFAVATTFDAFSIASGDQTLMTES
jgi:hypothetical protein